MRRALKYAAAAGCGRTWCWRSLEAVGLEFGRPHWARRCGCLCQRAPLIIVSWPRWVMCPRTRLFAFRLHDLTFAVQVPPRASAHQFRWRHPVAPGGGWRVGTRQWVASESLVPACAVLDVATRWRALFSAFVASCAGLPWTWVATHACRPLRTAIKINRHASSCTHPLANTRVCLCVARESGCSVRVLLERKCTTQTSTLTM